MTRMDVFAPITKRVKDPDTGHLTVFGKITGPDLDLDKQRMDPEWLRKAVPDWFTSGANVRMMHQPVAVGKGVELSEEQDGWYLTSKIVDRDAIEKIEHDVLTGYSIGIKSPQIRRGKDAPNGIICGGAIVETSVVDRPCLPTAKFVMAKTVEADGELAPAAEWADPADLNSATAAEAMGKFAWTPEQWEALPNLAKDAVTKMLTESPLEGAVISEADSLAMHAQLVAQYGPTGAPADAAKATTADNAQPQDGQEAKAAEPGPPATTEETTEPAAQEPAAKAAAPSETVDPAGTDATDTSDLDERIERAIAAALAKRAFTAEQREEAADNGQALSDGSFPIKNVADLKNAIKAVGRAKDPAAAKRHIIQRAKALGREDLLPDTWKGVDPDLIKADGDWTHDPTELAAIRDGLINVIKAELDEFTTGDDERCDLSHLLCALSMYLDWWQHEAAMGETSSPFGPQDNAAAADTSDMVQVELAAEADTTKSAAPQTPALSEERVNQLITAAVTKATEASEGRVKALEAELAKVKSQPIPGGPVLTRTAADTNRAALKDEHLAKAARFRAMADQVTDQQARAGYLQMAAEAEAKAAETDSAA